MRLSPRRILIGLPLIVTAIPIAYLAFMYGLGRMLVEPPQPSTAPIPALLADALWADAGGGRETELRPLNPIGLFRYVTCFEDAHNLPEPDDREAQRFDCRSYLPAMPLREHLASQHIRDQHLERTSFRGGAASFSTMLGFSSSWTKDEFLRTVAERAQFGSQWQGATSAARAMFDAELEALTLPQAALLAARAGLTGPDPFCAPESSARARNRVLARMLENGVISEAQFRDASAGPLGLRTPAPDLRPCA